MVKELNSRTDMKEEIASDSYKDEDKANKFGFEEGEKGDWDILSMSSNEFVGTDKEDIVVSDDDTKVLTKVKSNVHNFVNGKYALWTTLLVLGTSFAIPQLYAGITNLLSEHEETNEERILLMKGSVHDIPADPYFISLHHSVCVDKKDKIFEQYSSCKAASLNFNDQNYLNLCLDKYEKDLKKHEEFCGWDVRSLMKLENPSYFYIKDATEIMQSIKNGAQNARELLAGNIPSYEDVQKAFVKAKTFSVECMPNKDKLLKDTQFHFQKIKSSSIQKLSQLQKATQHKFNSASEFLRKNLPTPKEILDDTQKGAQKVGYFFKCLITRGQEL